jgi:hypothetical protein
MRIRNPAGYTPDGNYLPVFSLRLEQRRTLEGEASEADPSAPGPERADPLPQRELCPAPPRLPPRLPQRGAAHQEKVIRDRGMRFLPNILE